jgi:hypothetical protein
LVSLVFDSKALCSALLNSTGFGSNSAGSAERMASSTGRGRGSGLAGAGAGSVTTEPNIGDG